MKKSATILEWAALLRDGFAPRFERLQGTLRHEFPQVDVALQAHLMGSPENPSGYVLGLSCGLPQASPLLPDEVTLLVLLTLEKQTPAVEAEVAWGDPSGRVEAAVSQQPLPLTPISLRQVERGMDKLEMALFQALERARPAA